jgi:uncharacterized membrane protein YcfT
MLRETPPRPAAEPAATSRFDGVDLLRGLSIIAVILLHGQIRLHVYSILLKTTLPGSSAFSSGTAATA